MHVGESPRATRVRVVVAEVCAHCSGQDVVAAIASESAPPPREHPRRSEGAPRAARRRRRSQADKRGVWPVPRAPLPHATIACAVGRPVYFVFGAPPLRAARMRPSSFPQSPAKLRPPPLQPLRCTASPAAAQLRVESARAQCRTPSLGRVAQRSNAREAPPTGPDTSPLSLISMQGSLLPYRPRSGKSAGGAVAPALPLLRRC